MKRTSLLVRSLGAVLVAALCAGSLAAQRLEKTKPAQQTGAASVERDIREFLDQFAEDLRAGRRAAIAERHDRRGYFKMGNGKKTFFTFEETKDRYLNRWRPPKQFAWRDITIEVLSPNAAIVLALFDWQRQTGETLTLSFTGLLIKSDGKWRIRIEDESAAPPVKSSAQ